MSRVLEPSEKTSIGKKPEEFDNVIMEPEKPQKPKSNTRQTVFLRLFMLIFVGAVAAAFWWLWAQGREETDDAYLDGHVSNISCRISGNIENVFVTDNQVVKAGQPLVEIDPNDYQVRVEQMTAALAQMQHQAAASYNRISQTHLSSQGQTAQATADVSSVKAQIDQSKSALLQAAAETRQARAKVVEQEAQVKYAETDFERYQKVWDAKVVTKQQFDKAKQGHDVAIAQLNGAQQGLQAAETKEVQAQASLEDAIGRLERSKGGMTNALATTQQKKVDEESHESDLWAMKKAQADLKQAQLQLSYCHINAPVAGRIGRKSAEIGQHVESGQMLMALVQDNPWITANFKETQVGRMRPGQPVEISIDTFPGRKFTGTIESVAPASGAKFSILPPDNATGNFTKVVQRIPVKIVFDKESISEIKDKLSPGMSCIATVLFKH